MSSIDNIVSAEWVLNAAFQALIILGLGVLFIFLSRHKAAPLRSGIGLITMGAFIFLPVLSVSLNELGCVPLRTALPFTIQKASNTSVTVSYNLAEIPRPNKNEVNPSFIRKVWTGPVFIKIVNMFGIIWMTGLLFMLLRLAVGAAAIHKLKRGMVEVHNPRIFAALNSAEKAFSRRTKARVFVSQKTPYPMAVGVFKPVVLVPEYYVKKLKDSQIRGILVHELSHIFHGDLAAGILQRLVTAINWWNPLAYALSRAFSRAREEISDNHVLLHNDSKEYAECLIDLAEKTTLWNRLSVSVGLASPHIPLKDRVKHILSKERIMETNLKKSTIAVMAVSAFLFLAAVAGSRLIFASDKPAATIEKVDAALPELLTQEQQNQEEEQKSEKKDVKAP